MRNLSSHLRVIIACIWAAEYSRLMKKRVNWYSILAILIGFGLAQSAFVSAIAANPPVPAILEGGECKTLEEVAPISGTNIKVTCVEKNGKNFWSTNPTFYKKVAEVSPKFPCDADCEADRQGIAAAELEALEAQKYFPKWVLDGQTYFSNQVQAKVKLVFGKGEYFYHFPMPQPTPNMLANPSVNVFGSYKLLLMKWAEVELASLSKANFESEGDKESNKASGTSKVKLEVTKNSEGKYLVEVFSNTGDKSLLLNGTKKSSKNIFLNLMTDESGYASILTDQKLSGYKLVLGSGSKVTASTTVK